MGGCGSKNTEPHVYIDTIQISKPSVIDIKALEAEMGDLDFVKELLIETKIDINSNLISIKKSIITKDYPSLSLSSHSIKGIALSMKCGEMATISSKLETMSRDGESGSFIDKDDVKTLINELKDEIDRFESFHNIYCT